MLRQTIHRRDLDRCGAEGTVSGHDEGFRREKSQQVIDVREESLQVAAPLEIDDRVFVEDEIVADAEHSGFGEVDEGVTIRVAVRVARCKELDRFAIKVQANSVFEGDRR